ncbi:hypothetical protein [Prescottella subtropica]|uniref:hypothetical protein n=1 Tax=Prescottella subtropica TaxID=2545757 RepID=UPI0010F5774A|nr:hypothetical protein [Prescottella subtropica]
MDTNRSSHHRQPNGYRWFSHPLTSLITVAVLAVLLSIPFGTNTGALTLAGMLTFLTACKGAYNSSRPPE